MQETHMEKNCCVSHFMTVDVGRGVEPMSESVLVNFVANAPWQMRRFLQLCLRHGEKLVKLLPPPSSHTTE